MANKLITDLTAASALDGSEAFHAMQGGNSREVLASQIATYITALLIDSAPATLDTLNELAAALGDDPDFATTMTNALAGKVPNTRTITAGAGMTGGGALDADRSIAADLATAAQIRANTVGKLLTTPNAYAAMAPVTLTDAATISMDMATGIAFTVTLGGNRTLGNPTNVPVGKSGVLRVVQDGTGNRTLNLASNWKMAEGNAPDLSTAANAKDSFSFLAWSATDIELYPIGKAFS